MSSARSARLRTPGRPRSISGLLMGVALCSPAASLAVQPVLQIAPEFRRWSFEQPRAEHRVDQSYVAADLALLFESGLHLAVGADFVSSVHDDGVRTGNLDGLGEVRLLAEHRFAFDRVRVRATGIVPLYEDGYLPREIRVLRMLEIPELEFPLTHPGAGGQQALEVAAQLVRRRALLAQIAIGLENRGAYALREDGLELEPGGVGRFGASLDHAVAGWVAHHGAIVERPGMTALGGRDAFRNGTRLTWNEAITRTRAGRTWRGELSLLFGWSGELHPGTTLVADPLRSGNRVRWSLGHERASSWPIRIALTGTHYRGFSGTLGHADWITPSLELGHRFGPGVLEGSFDLSVGEVREGGSLGGVGLRLAWRGGLF